MSRKPLPLTGGKDGKLGRRGASVRAFIEGDLARVFWMEAGRQRKESWPNTTAGRAEAKAYAEGVAERLAHKGPAEMKAITLREMFDAYWLAESPALRPKSRISYLNRWRRFELFAGRSTHAHTVTLERLDEYRRALTAQGRAINQVGHLVASVKRVYRFAVERDLIPPSKVPSYRFKRPRGEATVEMAEYRTEEAVAILAQWSPKHPRHWRPYVATMLFAFCGPRASALFGLEWRDVDFEAGEFVWRKELDKVGKRDRRQPMPEPVRDALLVALGWAGALGYRGPYVFCGATAASRGEVRELAKWEKAPRRGRAGATRKPRTVRDQPWSYSAYIDLLRLAEEAAEVPYVKYRGAHGWRRMSAGNIFERTHNVKDALDWIGDTDLRVGSRYLFKRSDRMHELAASLSLAPAAEVRGLLEPGAPARETGLETDPNFSPAPETGVSA